MTPPIYWKPSRRPDNDHHPPDPRRDQHRRSPHRFRCLEVQMSNHLFIHSDLDDAGLSPAEFRVLAHLSRRAGKDGICHPGIRSISQTCRISRGTVGTVLESLEKRRFIATSKRHGLLTEYTVTTESGIAATVLIQGTPTVSIQGTDCPNPRHGLYQSKARKVIHEDNPLKVIQGAKRKRFDARTVSLPFSSDAFQTAWNEWCRHRSEIRKPLTATSTAKQLATIATIGEPRAIAAISHSIENGWQGIFEPKAGHSPKKQHANTAQHDPRFGFGER